MIFLYNTIITVYSSLVRLLSIMGNIKAQQLTEGQNQVWNDILKSGLPKDNKQIIWFHFASLGEFEQGKPLVEKIKNNQENTIIVATFFSPSGFLNCHDQLIDFKFYLPWDTHKNAKKLIEIFNPKFVFFVKYEFWYHYLSQLKSKNIPVYLISGSFRSNQVFFKWYGNFYRKILSCFKNLYVQNKDSKKLLLDIDIDNVVVSGDTRYDQCYKLSQMNYENKIIEHFKNNQFCIIAGSTWLQDENVLIDNPKNYKLIIAPHDITRSKEIATRFKNALLYSEYDFQKESNILIIDNIGILSKIYRYASITYIGGGFGNGLHNILEPLAYGKPVIFGSNFNKFPEAAEAISYNIAHSVINKENYQNILYEYINNSQVLNEKLKRTRDYFNNKIGATNIIYTDIFKSS